jgi:hypothetical protein
MRGVLFPAADLTDEDCNDECGTQAVRMRRTGISQGIFIAARWAYYISHQLVVPSISTFEREREEKKKKKGHKQTNT